MPAEKIIFLDFDGPLSNHRVTLATGDMKSFDPVTIAILNLICELSGAKIVCTSTRAPVSDVASRERVMQRFTEARLNLQHLHEDWSCRYDNGPRKGHIEKWLAGHPEVTHTATVDDKPVDVPNLILVDRFNGLSVQDAIKIMTAFDLDPQAIFNKIGRDSAGSEDSTYRASKIKLPPLDPA